MRWSSKAGVQRRGRRANSWRSRGFTACSTGNSSGRSRGRPPDGTPTPPGNHPGGCWYLNAGSVLGDDHLKDTSREGVVCVVLDVDHIGPRRQVDVEGLGLRPAQAAEGEEVGTPRTAVGPILIRDGEVEVGTTGPVQH